MVQLLIKISLFVLMLTLGLGLQGTALQQWRQRPALFARVLIGSCLLVPLLALVLLKFSLALPVAPPVRYGIALLALSPSAPLTLHKTGRQGGNREMAALLQVLAAIAAIVTIPLLATLFRGVFSLKGWDLAHTDVALQVLTAQVLPLLLGLGLRRWFPAITAKLLRPLEQLANGLVLVLLVVILGFTLPAVGSFLVSNLLALPLMAAMVLLSLAIGWLLAGPDPAESTTTALVTSMRNPGLALLFASSHAPGIPAVKLAILSYVLITALVSIPFLLAQKRRHLQPPQATDP
jgi:predicted Na+-dependent transporter